jgi:acylphosphatase
MKKAVRLFITGNMQSMFFKQFIKENADIHKVKGFLRILEDSRVEIFIEGDSQDVNQMVEVCKIGPKFTTVRKVEEKDERFQGMKEFKVLNF